MRTRKKNQTKRVEISIDAQLWRGLCFEASFLKDVFGCPATPEDILHDIIRESRRSLGSRLVGVAR